MLKLRIVLQWIAVNVIGSLITFAIFDAPLLKGFRHPEYRGAIFRYSAMAIAMFFAIGAFQVIGIYFIDVLLRRRGRALRATVVATVAILYAVIVPTVALLTLVHAMMVAVPFFLATGLIFGLWLTLTPAALPRVQAATP